MIGKTIKFLAKVVLWAVFLALIIPVGYFAVRMGKPMDRPEYKGLTYYQYLEWQQIEHEKSGEAYRATHPKAQDNNVGEVCNGIALTFGHAGLFFSQGPALILDSALLGRPFNAVHFLPNWWANFEREHLVVMRGNSGGTVICRIPNEIPDEYALSVGAHLPEEEVVQ